MSEEPSFLGLEFLDAPKSAPNFLANPPENVRIPAYHRAMRDAGRVLDDVYTQRRGMLLCFKTPVTLVLDGQEVQVPQAVPGRVKRGYSRRTQLTHGRPWSATFLLARHRR